MTANSFLSPLIRFARSGYHLCNRLCRHIKTANIEIGTTDHVKRRRIEECTRACLCEQTGKSVRPSISCSGKINPDLLRFVLRPFRMSKVPFHQQRSQTDSVWQEERKGENGRCGGVVRQRETDWKKGWTGWSRRCKSEEVTLVCCGGLSWVPDCSARLLPIFVSTCILPSFSNTRTLPCWGGTVSWSTRSHTQTRFTQGTIKAI
jgi:hypothetical protein